MALFDKELITRAIQKQDKTRVALRKSACGAIMIDGFTFSVSVESDGAYSDKGAVFTLSGESVSDGSLKVEMVDIVIPSGSGTKTIKRKPSYVKTKDGKSIYRLNIPEAKIPECADGDLLTTAPLTEEELAGSMNKQFIFRFTPCYSGKKNTEVMINIYPTINPIDGACTEWVPLTSDREFFEHGGFAAFTKSLKKKK